MSLLREIRLPDGSPYGWAIRCPACEAVDKSPWHVFVTNGSRGWTFDGNLERPTFSPSMLSREPYPGGVHVCHSFVRNGRIEYLGDCTHAMAGQTIDLPEVDRD